MRLPHPWSGDSQGQETFLAPSSDEQTHNYDTECSNHHHSLSTLRPKGLSHSKMKWWAIYKFTSEIYTECHVTNLQLNKLHDKTLQNQVSAMVSLKTLWDFLWCQSFKSQFLCLYLFLCLQMPRISVLLFNKLSHL